ncbi:cell division protein FtsA [Lachnospiraceae bacterium KM106-2]|nr:cell division protein FtsA [Lachnospiraceae bacterium KM106-2]
MSTNRFQDDYVFGLDIGTRSIVGTVGYRDASGRFKVAAQAIREHETRAMLDGQIHNIEAVANTIADVKQRLEQQLDCKLKDVCIAAAGRVLKTVTVNAKIDFDSETVIDDEGIHSLELVGVQNAYDKLKEQVDDEKFNFYCVGYTVIKYYLNEFEMLALEGHKATSIGCELLATFLPEEVIDGLYSAVARAGLEVTNLTLEPIAAIQVAIPEKFRLLNLALVDVGAGTSDICITQDGSITAYGMIPFAGDEITECILKRYLVDFDTAEEIKRKCLTEESITFNDIMGLPMTISKDDVLETVDSVVRNITRNVAEKIKELNGGKSVSAVFVVGGGGKISSFVTTLSEYLDLPKERVALRGEEVLKEVDFADDTIKKDSLLVTPIGICLNYYEQKNNFIYVSVNDERVKLYDNSKLTVMDALMQAGFTNAHVFPRRGHSIEYMLNGHKRMARGELGEAAVIKVNGVESGMTNSIYKNDRIEIEVSTAGEDAKYEIRQIPEFHSTIRIQINGQYVECPKYAEVNGNLASEYYHIQDGDEITIRNYNTLAQVLGFMDLPYTSGIEVNNIVAGEEEPVYAEFVIRYPLYSQEAKEEVVPALDSDYDLYEPEVEEVEEVVEDQIEALSEEKSAQVDTKPTDLNEDAIMVSINGKETMLQGKKKYIFVDILDVYPFDINEGKGKNLVQDVNGTKADFTSPIKNGDLVRIFWEG